MKRRAIPVEPPVRWILLAHRSGAKLFSSRGKGLQLSLVRKISFPDGRRQNREIKSDKQGSYYSSTAGRVNSTGSFSPSVEATEHNADIFAHELCTMLSDGRTHQLFDELILVAEPGFLGTLKGFLDKETTNRILAAVNQSWIDLTNAELRERLGGVLRNQAKIA